MGIASKPVAISQMSHHTHYKPEKYSDYLSDFYSTVDTLHKTEEPYYESDHEEFHKDKTAKLNKNNRINHRQNRINKNKYFHYHQRGDKEEENYVNLYEEKDKKADDAKKDYKEDVKGFDAK